MQILVLRPASEFGLIGCNLNAAGYLAVSVRKRVPDLGPGSFDAHEGTYLHRRRFG